MSAHIKEHAFALALLLATLGGCASEGVPREVLVPVAAECAAPVMPEKPELAISNLEKGKATAPAVVSAYTESLTACIAYTTQLETLLNAYAPKAAK